MQSNRTAAVRVKIVKIGLAGRVVIFISVVLLKYDGRFLHETFRELMHIMVPLACLYVTLFVKFIVKTAHQYPEQGPKLSKDYIGLGYYSLLLLNICEFGLIIYEAFSTSQLPALSIPDFLYCIVVIEAIFGILAGFYISELFGDSQAN